MIPNVRRYTSGMPQPRPAAGTAFHRIRRQLWIQGLRLGFPGAVGTFVWGIVTGIALIKFGLTLPQAVGMSLLVYSGTAQLATLPLIAVGSSLTIVLITAALSNLRFAIYSATVAADFRRAPLLRRMLLGYMTTDSGLAVYLSEQRRRPVRRQKAALFLGINMAVYTAWQSGTMLGIALAGLLPAGQKMSFLGVLALIGLFAPQLRSRPMLTCAAVAAGAALVGMHWPYKLGMFTAIVAAVLVVLAIERGKGGGPAASVAKGSR